MLDIIFISYDEACADEHFALLKARFPHARRVHGVKGIANAHIEAARKANTRFFYVVDADAVISPSFDFSYKPTEHEAEYTHVWYARNPATGTAYGYGGVKLFNKQFFRRVKSALDFTTTLTKDLKVMEEVACTTHFNYDPFTAFRGAYRETIKLYLTSKNQSIPAEIREEASARLEQWKNPLKTCKNRKFVVSGVKSALLEAENRGHESNFMFINDHDLINAAMNQAFAEYKSNKDPTPLMDNPMKPEFFFTTRLASILYDPLVLENTKLTEIRDALSDGQMLSKNWLVQELKKLIEEDKIHSIEKRTVICGGWIGTLALMINTFELQLILTSVDIDHRSNQIAEKLNHGFKFDTLTQDMNAVEYERFDIVINTSSEHIDNIPEWVGKIPKGKVVVVQNNDYLEGEGHISTVKSVSHLKKLLNLSEILYEGTKSFPQYNRFMVIGRT